MAYSRRLGVIGILGACFLTAVGCGDDEDKKDNDAEAGEGGESSTAGSAGKSAGGSNAGRGGNAGNAGRAGGGTAGSATAGSAGEGGAAGEAGGGAGGDGPSGNAGEGGAAAGAGGVSSSGAGGEGGAAVVFGQCVAGCQQDADCAMGEDTTNKCNQTTKQCFDPSFACEANADCVVSIGRWDPCGVDSTCADGAACIEWQGEGRCAFLPFPDFGCGTDVATTLPLFGAQGDEEVCVPPAKCNAAGECILSCVAFFGICDDNGACDEESGLCKCSTDDQCALNVCGDDSLCAECVTDAECAGNDDGHVVCRDGKCGCDADSCPGNLYANAPAVCQ